MSGTAIAPQIITGVFAVGAAGLAFAGALLVRHLDRRLEHTKWLREERLDAVVELSSSATALVNAYFQKLRLSNYEQIFHERNNDYNRANNKLKVLLPECQKLQDELLEKVDSAREAGTLALDDRRQLGMTIDDVLDRLLAEARRVAGFK